MDGLAKWLAIGLLAAVLWPVWWLWWWALLPIEWKWLAIGLPPAVWLLWLLWWLWWKLPQRELDKLLAPGIGEPKDRVDVEDTLRKTIGQAIGAIAVLFGAGFAVWQFLEQRAVSQDQVRISQQQVQSSNDLLISNQIAKGFEQLGSDKIEVRLGGIYALEGILHMPIRQWQAVDYRQPVLEALCAFVRENTIGMIVAVTPTTDIQAVLTVIGRRPEDLKLVNLSNAVVPGAVLRKANLSGAELSGANLNGAELFGAHLNDADLGGANLNGAELFGANMSLANLNHADLTGAYLSDADLGGANLYDTNLTGAHLTSAHLDDAYLNDANLTNADLNDTNLTNARLSAAHLNDANLTRANLTGASLTGASLSDAHLNDAHLNDANLNGAILTGANLSDADLSSAYLSGVSLDNQEQLSMACGKPKVLPQGFTLDRPCLPKNPK